MALQQNIELKLKQQLTITPQLQQAIKLLNMNQQELSIEISQMLANNFMLQQQEDIKHENDESEPLNEDPNQLSEELPFDADWSEHYDHDWQEQHPLDKEKNFEDFTPNPENLENHLIEQLSQKKLDEKTQQCALNLIYHIDPDGYLREPIETLSEAYNTPKNTIKEALEILKSLDPIGIAAKDLEECLNLQIAALPPNTPHLEILKRIMKRYFHYIGKNSALICQRLNLSQSDYEQAIKLLKTLNPHPGQNYQNTNENYIQPDIIVREKHGISYIEIDPSLSPTLSINKEYSALIDKSEDPQEKELLQAQLQEARWFLNAIDKRNDTIKRVAGLIVALQQDFFQYGEKAMRPLTRQKIAEMLELSESTISRAVNGKYLSSKRGLYELRYFFSNQIENLEGEEQSATAIKALIQEIINQENPQKPLSDNKISAILEKEHKQQIARRTIAKYREELGIPTSSIRRKN